MAAARFGPSTTDERVYAADLWAQIPDNSLTLLDRNFRAAKPLAPNCLDNAAMESWFSTLKFELGETVESIHRGKEQLFDYIEVGLGGLITATDYPEGGEGRITAL